MRCTIGALFMAVSVVLLSGCGGSSGPVAEAVGTVPAGGVLTFQGKPLAGFQVTLLPEDESRAAIGITDADGRFVLGTNEAGDGAVVGRHNVGVSWVVPDNSGEGDVIDDVSQYPKPPVALPANVGDPKTSGKSVEIPAEGNAELRIEL